MKRLMFAAVAAISLGVTAFAGTEPTCSGGDYIYSLVNGDKTDWVHVFSNGTGSVAFTVPSNVKGTFEVQYLVVAGGGGGGGYYGGGGGAGYVQEGALTLEANDTVAVVVGAGGAGGEYVKGDTKGVSGENGGDSSVVFEEMTVKSEGGGGGGNYSAKPGVSGGCGGGGGSSKALGAEGTQGGNGAKANATYGGGGGGAGGNAPSPDANGAPGGAGKESLLTTGAPVVYGVGGRGGSSKVVADYYGLPGANGTGNGGNGGGSGAPVGGKGGDGIVILRYTEPETSGEAYKLGEVDDQAYTGDAIEPAIVVTKGAKALEQGKDFSVAYFDNVNVGAARAEVTGLGEHEGLLEGTVYFQIVQAANEWTVAPKVEPALWLKRAEPGVFSAEAKFGTVVISYEGDDVPSSLVGTHTATFSVAGTENYAGLPETDVTYTVVIHDGEPDAEPVTYTWSNPEGGDWIAPANWTASLEKSFGFPYSKEFATALFGAMEGVEALTVRVTDDVMTKQLRFESAPAVTLDLGGNSYDAAQVYSLLAGLVTVSNGSLTAGASASGVNFSGKGLTVGPGGTVSIRTVNAGTNAVQLESRDGGDLTVQRFASSDGSSGLTVRAEGEGTKLSFACQYAYNFNSTNWVVEARDGGTVTLVNNDFTRGERNGAFVAADGAIVFGNNGLPVFGTNVTDEVCSGARISISGRNGAFYSDHGADIVFGSNAEEAQSLAVPPALEIAIPAEGFAGVPLEAKPYKTLSPDVVIGSNVVVRLDVTDAAKRGEVCLVRAAGRIDADLVRLAERTKGRSVEFTYERRTNEDGAQELWLSYRKSSGLMLLIR